MSRTYITYILSYTTPDAWFDDETNRMHYEDPFVVAFDSKDDAVRYGRLIAKYLDRHITLTKNLYEECEHGLSAWLCAGPGHYPSDH